MNDIIELGITKEEAIAMDAEMERMLAAMRKANEQIARDQEEFDRLQAETRVILDRLKERKHVEPIF